MPGIEAVTTRDELGGLLTDLRGRSGKSLRALARAVGPGTSTIGDWCAARTLPFPSQDIAFIRLLRELGVDDPDPWLDALVRLRAGARRIRRADTPPYRGLDSFRCEDAERFFGRDGLVDRTRARLAEVAAGDGPRVLVVVGPSGSGKSSLLHAGLFPRLRDEGIPAVALTPGVPPTDARVVVVDQVEELFTQWPDPGEREAVLAALVRLASDGPDPPVVVLGLRIDFYPHLAATGLLTEALQHHQVLVGPMSREDLTAAIVEPARQAGFSVDEALVEVILHDFVPPGSLAGHHDPGSLPLLSHVLLETWHHATRGRMTIDDYRAAGGIERAVEGSAEDAYARLSDDDQGRAREVFLRLVNVDRNAVATRRSATYDELGDRAREFLAPFIDARLVTADESTVEITHEALLAAWPRLHGWIEEDREGVALHRRISEATGVWLDHERDPSTLARGTRLAAMQQWAAGDAARYLNRDERDFLDASADAAAEAERSRRRGTRRLRALASVATVLAVLAASLAVVASSQRSGAEDARDDALSRQLAVSGDQQRDNDSTVAANLAMRGYRVAPTAQARSALLQTMDSPFPTRYTGGPGTTAVAASAGRGLVAASNSDEGSVQLFTQRGGGLARAGAVHLDDAPQIYALALTSDETILAVGDTNHEITLWDVSDPAAPSRLGEPLTGPTGPIQHLAVTPAGTELAATGAGDGVFRWDITDPRQPRSLDTIPSATVSWGLAYGPDGASVAFGQDDGHVRLWALAPAPHEVAVVQSGDQAIYTVAFSPDGRWLAGGSNDGEVHVWDVTTPVAPDEVTLPESRFRSRVNAAAFSPDGAHLVAGSSDESLRVWDTGTWAHRGDLPHPAALTDAQFIRGGEVLVTGAVDGTTRLWELAAVLPPELDARVFGLTFSGDGTRLAAFSGADAGVWDVSDPVRPARRVAVTAPDADDPFSGAGDMSPDGRLLAPGTRSGHVHLVDVSDPESPAFVGDPLDASPEVLVEQTAFSPDGSLLAAASDDGSVHLWDVGDPARPRPTAVLEDTAAIMLNVTWSPTAPLLAASSEDGLTYLYDVSDPDEPEVAARLDGSETDAYAAAFTPDGRTLAVGGSDSDVLLWDVTDPGDPERIGEPITGPPSRIFDLAFGPGGTTLAAAVTDGTIWVWDTPDLRDPVRAAVFGPFEGPDFAVAVSPDGSLVAGSGADQTIHLWPSATEATIDAICARVGDPMTADEWARYVPDEPFRPLC
ncbi:MAG TPA: helix-turn-helix domain-containing protein [Acidimicrobiales bacterium]